MFSPSPDLQTLADALRPALGLPGHGEFPLRLLDFASKRHRIAPLISRAVTLGGTAADAQATQALANEAQRSAVRSLRQKAAALSFGKLMEQGGIAYVEIKGSRLGEVLYGGDSLRHSKDVDMLVASAQVADAIDLAVAGGYLDQNGKPLKHGKALAMLRHHREVELRDPKSGVTVELHARMLEHPPQAWNDAALLKAELDLGCPEYVLYLILHGASTNWNRLKMQADLFMIARLATPEVRTRVLELARRLECLPAVAASFELCRALWDAAHPQEWIREIGLSANDPMITAHLSAYAREINREDAMPLGELLLRRLELQRDPPIFGQQHPARLPVIRDRAALWFLRKF